MKFKIIHTNFNVMDLEKSVSFYEKALGLKVMRRHEAQDGSFMLVFMGDGITDHQVELTWLRDRKEPYDRSLFPIQPMGQTRLLPLWQALK